MYIKSMLDSIKRLEETRQERVNQKWPRFTPDAKAELLKNFHPDYKKGTTRKLKVGTNKGETTVHEFADMLEAFSNITPKDIDLSQVDYESDVLIIGGGGAGASAALEAEKLGVNVLLSSKLRIGDSNTMMAQGGIQGADKENDSPSIHYLDVLGGGGFKNHPELVKALVMDGPFVIKWLEDLGVMFGKEEDGTMITIHGGGTSRKRMHSARDYTGGEIMKTLRDEVLNKNIDIIEFSPTIELLTSEGKCTGAILYNMESKEYVIVKAKSTIIATGGSGRNHVQEFPTSNHYGATGDGLVIAYRAGCSLTFLDTIQYHPTGAAYPEQIVGLLVTEKVRGLGAQLINNEGNQFVYELETRDAEAAAIIKECQQGKGVTTQSGMQGVWLDSPLIDLMHGEGTIKKQLPAMFRQYQRFEIDITKDPILIFPTQHYQNGGIVINDKAETNIGNLYCAGEAVGGIHGRNRLMGNSLLDIIVFGRRAGQNAAKNAEKNKHGKLTLEHVKKFHKDLNMQGIKGLKKSPILLPDYRGMKTKLRRIDFDF